MIAEILHKLAGQFEQEDHRYYPRPSLAGPDRCIRQMVYWGLEIPRDALPGRTYYVFNDSSWHEELTGDWIRKSAYQLHSQQMEVKATYGDMVLTGHIDGILTDPAGNDYLLEHKAINHFTFQKYAAGELPLDYLAQAALYLYGLKTDQPDLSKFILLIKNKNTSAYLEFSGYLEGTTLFVTDLVDSNGVHIEINQALKNIIGETFYKFLLVKKSIEAKILPKRPYDQDDWHCNYCGWSRACWKGYAEEFAELKTGKDLPNEVTDMVRYRQELAAQRIDIEKEEKKLTEEVKRVLKEADTREGRAGEYIVKLALRERETLDKALIPPAIIEQARKVIQYEQLFISKLKEGKNGRV